MPTRMELPLVDARASVSDAFAALKQAGRAALVVADGERHTLVLGAALLQARAEGITALRKVPSRELSRELSIVGDESQMDDGAAEDAFGFGVTEGTPRPSYVLQQVGGGNAIVETAHEWLALGLTGPDMYQCDLISRHTYPDPPPDVRDGQRCPKCIKDTTSPGIGTVRLVP